MTVEINDRRRGAKSVGGLGLANGTWFAVLRIEGMSNLLNTQPTNDPLVVSPAVAKKMAVLVAGWKPPEGWGSLVGDVKMKLWLIEFLLTCNGFRTS